MHPPLSAGGVGGLTRPQLLYSLRGVAGKEGLTFFRAGGGGVQLSHKKIKSEKI